jgi:dipeptidyl aminopeptidase/acylaminoacyl peptidase
VSSIEKFILILCLFAWRESNGAVRFGALEAPITDIGSLNPQMQNALWRSLFLGRHSAERDSIFRDASPLYKVDKHASPMLLVCGQKDTLTPISQCTLIEEKLANAGVDYRLIRHDGGHLNSGLEYEQRKRIFSEIADYLKEKRK